MKKKIIFFTLIFLGVFIVCQSVFSATSTGGFVTVNLNSSYSYPAVGAAITITAGVNINTTQCVINFDDGIEISLDCWEASDCLSNPNCTWSDSTDPTDPRGSGSCSYSFSHSYGTSGEKFITFYCINSASYEAGVDILIEVGGTPRPCEPDGCNNYCPQNCDVSQDYDCACVGGNGCCAPGCDFTTDSDCPPPRPCSPIQCDQICQPNCNVSQDSDCGCLGGNGCCAPGCTIANDSDCPPVPTQYDNPLTWSDVPELLQQTIETIFGMLMALAVLIIIIGGYVMVTSGGIPLRFDKGKKIVIWALIGFAVSAVSRGIIALVEMIIGKQ
ncbi:pilin [Patescibacteria group bacterium]|nr:pilin [Patescibacteria group bacterium]MBU4162278.1 pilin [Patescibacteria group bacterium]